MARKKQHIEEQGQPSSPVHSSLLPPTLRIPPGRLALVESNPILRRVGLVLANGSRFANHPTINFGPHTGFLTMMHTALDRWIAAPVGEEGEALRGEQEQVFLQILQEYLSQADGHIPHALSQQESVASLEQIRLLIQQVNSQQRQDGFEQVGRYLLLLAHAPLDHF